MCPVPHTQKECLSSLVLLAQEGCTFLVLTPKVLAEIEPLQEEEVEIVEDIHVEVERELRERIDQNNRRLEQEQQEEDPGRGLEEELIMDNLMVGQRDTLGPDQ